MSRSLPARGSPPPRSSKNQPPYGVDHSLPVQPQGARRALFRLVLVLALACALSSPARADSVQYAYDAVGRLAAVIDPVNGSAVYQYDAVGNILSVKRSPASTLVVAQVTPGRAAPGTLVTIAGTALGDLSTTQVSFNGAAATPTAISATQITVPVPQGATSGPVSVTTAGGTASTAAPFQVVTQGPPTLSGFSPQVADQGAAVTISGSGFVAAQPG